MISPQSSLKLAPFSASEFARTVTALLLLCVGLWQQTARATDSVQTNMAANKLVESTNQSEANTSNGVAASSLTVPTNSTNSAFVLDNKHRLASGDRLSFRIMEDQDGTNVLLYVTDSGDLEVPYIGRVPAENKTCRELAAEIKTALEKDYYYQATVILAVDVMTKKSLGRVYLVGQVRLPGPIELPNDETLTVSKAILRAGSFTEYADRRHVKVTRKDEKNKNEKQSFTVDVGEIFDKGEIKADMALEPGDLITVPDRLIKF